MGFRPDDPVVGPMALPEGFDLTPEADAPNVGGGVIGAALRLENPVVSAVSGVSRRSTPVDQYDPDFRAYEDIQGTNYEQFADRFAGARNAEHSAQIKAQIDRELEDRRAIEAAGGWGFLAETAAGLLSPTNLLPGGAVVKGVQGGIRIGRTAMSVSLAAGGAVAIDEAVLQATQELRTPEESALAIGGSMILGGLLGGAAGSLSRNAYVRASAAAEVLPEAVHDFDAGLRSVGAAQNVKDLTVRREELFQFFNRSQYRVEEALSQYMPRGVASVVASPLAAMRPIVRSDPILRAMLSENIQARRALVDLVETPLQYKVNERGQTVLDGSRSVEAAVKTRRNTELVASFGSLKKYYQDYLDDGPRGKIATITAPIRGLAAHATDTEKLTSKRFMEEVGQALMQRDQHHIPQVQKAAETLRKEIYEKAKNDAIEVGLFDEDLQLKYAESYFMRVYNTEKINAHFGDGSADDILPVLEEQFRQKRDAAQRRLMDDDTVERAQAALYQSREALQQITRAMKKAEKRARDKRDRAQAAMTRENAIGRSFSNLKAFFDKRAKGLMEGVMQGEEYEAFKELVGKLRRLDKLEPPSLLKQIRSYGGIKDPRALNQWRNGDWVSDGTRTEIEAILDKRAVTVRRKDGMEIDMMREALAEAGYLPENSTVSDLLDLIRQEAGGQKVYSEMDAVELAEWEALSEIKADFDRMDIDVSKSLDKIIPKLPGMSRTQKITKAKAGEAGRAAKETGKRGDRSASFDAALRRYGEANDRLKELKEDIAPRVREEKKAIRQQIKEDVISVNKAKKARGADEYYANADDLEITEAAKDAIKSITGMKVGQHSFTAATSKPTRARVLDVPDELLMPWLEKDAGIVTGQYFNSIIPMIEMARKFDGDVNMSMRMQEILDEAQNAAAKVTSRREKERLLSEGKARVEDMEAMRDRILGNYGIPKNPNDGWVVASRTTRTLAYMGYLGGMLISALPDVAAMLFRNGLEPVYGAFGTVTDPKRMFRSLKDAREFGAAAEWFLNNRAMSWAELTDQYASTGAVDRGLGMASSGFSVATGMIPWNVAMKSIGGAFAASRMSKAAVAMSQGKATKADMIKLSENGINGPMADRIAAQIDKHADKNGDMWLPQGRLWDDQEAFDAFKTAMNREMDLQIITIGQDKPISFSSEIGKFFSQFKSFPVAAHHRIMLSGMQRADASVVGQVGVAMALGMLVSNIKAWQRDDEPKTGAAMVEDALDRSGLAGWLMEPYGVAAAAFPDYLSISGERLTRYQSRSMLQGALGPGVDMATGFGEGLFALANGNLTENDARKLARPVPGNNIFYLNGLFDQLRQAVAEIDG